MQVEIQIDTDMIISVDVNIDDVDMAIEIDI